MPSFSPIGSSSLTDTPSLDFKETTKKLDFELIRQGGEPLQEGHQESSERQYKMVSHFADEDDENIIIDLAQENFDTNSFSSLEQLQESRQQCVGREVNQDLKQVQSYQVIPQSQQQEKQYPKLSYQYPSSRLNLSTFYQKTMSTSSKTSKTHTPNSCYANGPIMTSQGVSKPQFIFKKGQQAKATAYKSVQRKVSNGNLSMVSKNSTNCSFMSSKQLQKPNKSFEFDKENYNSQNVQKMKSFDVIPKAQNHQDQQSDETQRELEQLRNELHQQRQRNAEQRVYINKLQGKLESQAQEQAELKKENEKLHAQRVKDIALFNTQDNHISTLEYTVSEANVRMQVQEEQLQNLKQLLETTISVKMEYELVFKSLLQDPRIKDQVLYYINMIKQ